jgi:hypothetical protein
MISTRIKNCTLSEEDKTGLNLILETGDFEFVQNYLKEIEMRSTAVKNLPTMEICRFYESGVEVKDIALKYDCTTNSITKHLSKGGFCWDNCRSKWIRGQVPTKSVKKNRQSEVVTWLLSGAYKNDTITTDILAAAIGCSRDQASAYLMGISKKKILGMENIGRGMYRFNPVLPSISQQKYLPLENEVVAVSQNKHSIACLKTESNELDIFQNVLALSVKVGGLDKLADVVKFLIDLKKK